MIKYQFAYDLERNVVNINDLSKECKNKSDKFLCLSCENELVTVLGEKRRKHFRHKVITEINCSPETYLHKLAKLKFYEVYQNCLEKKQPFIIKIIMDRVCDFYEKDFLQTCKIPPRFFEFDLTQEFKNIFLEKRVDSFIPDILLTSSEDKKLFIEIAVTHKSEKEKIKSNQVIEFLIGSEEDIQLIESCLFEESEKISFFNFNRLNKKGWCEGKCIEGMAHYAKEDALYNICVKFKNGESIFLQNETLAKIETLNTNNVVEIEYFSSLEIYLCNIAKQKFCEVYQYCINEKKPFLIKLKQDKICDFYEKDVFKTCQIGSDVFEHDLTKYFDLKYEKNSFIINVFLESKYKQKDKIYFEVRTQNKSKLVENQTFNDKIIKFIIRSEDDLKIIDSQIFDESINISFLNFKSQQKKNWCEGKCIKGINLYLREATLYNIFLIYKNGKSVLLEDQTLEEVYMLHQNEDILKIEFVSLLSYNTFIIYRHKIIDNYKKGFKIKSCFLCSYHVMDRASYKDGEIVCELRAKIGSPNMAIDCEYFRPDSIVF